MRLGSRPSLFTGWIAFALGAAVGANLLSSRAELPRTEKRVRHRAAWMRDDASVEIPARCDPRGESLFDALDEVLGVSFDPRTYLQDGGAERVATAIHRILERSESDEGCAHWLKNYYAYASAALYAAPEARGRDLLDVLSRLFAQDRLVPITPDLRRNWGGLWEKPGAILGTYDCETTTIVFDPFENPYDLGAVLAHEIDHLVRDKFSFWDHAGSVLKDVPAAILLDETLASLHAGFLELARIHPEANDEKPASDFNLYSPRGNLVALWERARQGSEPFARENFLDFLRHALFPDVRAYSSVQENWRSILRVVGNAYFPGGAPDSERVTDLLFAWKDVDVRLLSPLDALGDPASESTITVPGAGAFRLPKSASYAARERANFFARLDSRMNGVSPGCRIIRDSIADGKDESARYIGGKLGGESPGGNGGKPAGGNGGKPAGGNGGKPAGGNGGKPAGGHGGKPSRPIAPCLSPPEEV